METNEIKIEHKVVYTRNKTMISENIKQTTEKTSVEKNMNIDNYNNGSYHQVNNNTSNIDDNNIEVIHTKQHQQQQYAQQINNLDLIGNVMTANSNNNERPRDKSPNNSLKLIEQLKKEYLNNGNGSSVDNNNTNNCIDSNNGNNNSAGICNNRQKTICYDFKKGSCRRRFCRVSKIFLALETAFKIPTINTFMFFFPVLVHLVPTCYECRPSSFLP